MISWRIRIKGIVQGVGFRPFIYRLAHERGISGSVHNHSGGVEILCDCSSPEGFINDIKRFAPPLAHISFVEYDRTDADTGEGFRIIESKQGGGFTLIPPDSALCPDCRRELFDSNDRRHRYPFINCTNCGPRYSIMKSLPYDRPNTVMDEFTMCPDCASEYADPADRRFHAQPDCCSLCGPEISMGELKGEDALKCTVELINSGGIVSVKGLGGYHLVCDACNDSAVLRLRELKRRGDKPFAVMCREPGVVMGEGERSLFESPQAPVVLLKAEGASVSEYINPMGDDIGFMMPYTPLHELILDGVSSGYIVATSGNLRDEPIAASEDEAEENLGHYTSHFLHHNREIHNRLDDSVTACVDGVPYVIRRARGFAPWPVMLPEKTERGIAGMGAHLKSTVCLASDEYAFVSQYIGDLDNPGTRDFFDETFIKLKRLLGMEPDILVTDLHPDYHSTRFAHDEGAEVVQVQHHLAHMYSCCAENGISGDCIGVILDGTGLGSDGNIWGGEVFLRRGGVISREAHLPYTPQPGMDAAAKKPWMMAVSYIRSFSEHKAEEYIDNNMLPLVQGMLKSGTNCIDTSSAGRLFEGAGSLLLGIDENDFEGHAAMALERAADTSVTELYETNGFSHGGLISGLLDDIKAKTPIGTVSARFHNGFARMILDLCIEIRSRTGICDAVLSGGVFQNLLLLRRSVEFLRGAGFNVHIHSRVPANDGGISLGQVYAYTAGEKFLDKPDVLKKT
ncbi:carbamoyltransferase HypF [Limisalsivibrio acetivorans]|uniref:carbamoyltransferase HypF n=1 Tax=Limisalsivibrio acetivorans TaxID=1304888 RepID=UPI0003B6B8CD|nr:carbamoyltransferase HypF [Limisalsivibrio acetivorans]